MNEPDDENKIRLFLHFICWVTPHKDIVPSGLGTAVLNNYFYKNNTSKTCQNNSQIEDFSTYHKSAKN
jgi:hypothetical protein